MIQTIASCIAWPLIGTRGSLRLSVSWHAGLPLLDVRRAMPDVTVNVMNHADEEVAVRLEPWGAVYRLEPRVRKTVVYRGAAEPQLTVDLRAGLHQGLGRGRGDSGVGRPCRLSADERARHRPKSHAG
jgi:hypothetical protein